MRVLSFLSVDTATMSIAAHWAGLALLTWFAISVAAAASWLALRAFCSGVVRLRDRRFTRALDRARASWEVAGPAGMPIAVKVPAV
jgi:hypothetical protein